MHLALPTLDDTGRGQQGQSATSDFRTGARLLVSTGTTAPSIDEPQGPSDKPAT